MIRTYEHKSLSAIVVQTLSHQGPRCYEPAKRNKDGWRYVKHRFPIKGGITFAGVLARHVMENNALLARLAERRLFT